MKSKTYKKSGIFFGIILSIAFLARLVQILVDVDKSTGNLHSSAVNGMFAPVTLIIVIAIGAILYLLTPQKKLPEVNSKGSKFIGVAALLSGIALVFDGYMTFAAQKNTFNKFVDRNNRASTLELITKIKNQELVTNISMILLFISVMAAIYFILLSYRAFGNGKISKKLMAVFSLFLPLWCCVKLALDYIELTGMPILSEKIYNTIIICAIALFFMANIRVLSNSRRENSNRTTVAMGFLSIFAVIVFTIPRYLMTACYGYQHLISNPISNDIVVFAICLYVISYLTNVFMDDSDNEVEVASAKPAPVDTENIIE